MTRTNLAENFRRNLSRVMNNRKLNQRDMASLLGTSQPYVCQVLRGYRGVGLESVVKFAHALDMDPLELLRSPRHRNS